MKELALWVVHLTLSVALAYLLVMAFGFRVSVIGPSMEPTLSSGQSVMVDRLAPRFLGLRAGDVVVFYPGGNDRAHPYVKRIVAVPGDTVEIDGGELYVNGQVRDDGYDKIEEAGLADSLITLGSDEYFVLGDNRNNSEDSRFIGIGTVPEGSVIGRAWLALPADGRGLEIVR